MHLQPARDRQVAKLNGQALLGALCANLLLHTAGVVEEFAARFLRGEVFDAQPGLPILVPIIVHLHDVTTRNKGPFADEQRKVLKSGLGGNGVLARIDRVFIVVIEPAAGREIDASLGSIGNSHESDEDLAAEQVLAVA